MKKVIITSAIAAISGSVFAAGAFDGPYVQLGIGGVSSHASTSFNTSGITQTVTGGLQGQSTNSGDFIGQVLGGYSKSIDKLNLAGNIFYVIGNQNSGTQTTTGSYLGIVPWSASAQAKLENTWGLSVEPGYYVTDKTLGYLKFSWFNSTLKSNASVSALGMTDSTNASSNINGAGFGIGAKQLFTENLFGFVEYQYVTYGSTTQNFGSEVSASIKPSQNYGLVGIGYKF